MGSSLHATTTPSIIPFPSLPRAVREHGSQAGGRSDGRDHTGARVLDLPAPRRHCPATAPTLVIFNWSRMFAVLGAGR